VSRAPTPVWQLEGRHSRLRQRASKTRKALKDLETQRRKLDRSINSMSAKLAVELAELQEARELLRRTGRQKWQ
jgi:predicted  nucleic acid-binding Zn-ribbon protein